MAFSVERFVEDCRAVRDRPDWAQAVAELLRAAIREPAAIDALIAERGSSARKGFDIWLQSDALGQSFRLRVTNAALRTLDFRGGLDTFLLKASDEDLSPRALKIKRQLKAKLAEQPAAA